MTLIAVAALHNWHFMFGDLLLSQPAGPVRAELHLPTQDVTFSREVGSGHVITGLSQKLSVLNKNFAIGWSGTRIYAKTIIQEIINTFGPDYAMTWSELDRFLRAVDPSLAKEVSMVGMLWERDTNEIVHFGFGWDAKNVASPVFDGLWLAGSATEHWLEILKLYAASSSSEDAGITDYFRAVGKILNLSSYLIGGELNTYSNLYSFYGGGLEIVGIDDGEFRKIGDTIYLFWIVDATSPDNLVLSIHPLAIKFSYVGDVLLVRRTEFGGQDREVKEVPHLKKQITFVIHPIYRNLQKSEIEQIIAKGPPDLNSHIRCHYILINFSEDVHELMVTADIGNTNRVRFVNEDDKDYFDVPNSFSDRIFELVRQRVRDRERSA
jgi:hypothetical protein